MSAAKTMIVHASPFLSGGLFILAICQSLYIIYQLALRS